MFTSTETVTTRQTWHFLSSPQLEFQIEIMSSAFFIRIKFQIEIFHDFFFLITILLHINYLKTILFQLIIFKVQ